MVSSSKLVQLPIWPVTIVCLYVNVFVALMIGHSLWSDGFGSLVVSTLASGTRVRGFKLGRSRRIFRASEKSSACLPSEGK